MMVSMMISGSFYMVGGFKGIEVLKGVSSLTN